jgi:ORF6N domain
MPKKKISSKSGQTGAITTYTMVEQRILFIRGQKVMLDSDLGQLYGVSTRVLNQAVKRNLKHFPEDFMFRLTLEEANEILASRSQIVILKRGQNVKYAPYAFSEHGAVMLASVLNSKIAVSASIQVVRAFVRLRSILGAHKELAKKLESLDRKTDRKFKVVFELISKYLKSSENSSKKQIGFKTK